MTKDEAIEALPMTLTYDDIDRHFGVGRITVWRLMQEGKFPQYMKLGGKTRRWDTQEVLAWYRERQQAQKGNAAA